MFSRAIWAFFSVDEDWPYTLRFPLYLEIAHRSIQRVYLLQNWVEAQSYWVVLSAKTAKTIGLLPEKGDTGNLQPISIDIELLF
jgi:hypothetical protein